MLSVHAVPDALQSLATVFLFQFISQLLEVIPLSATAENEIALPADIKALQQHLCVVQLSRLLGIYHAMDKKEKLTVVQELMLRYRHGLEFGEKNLETNVCSSAFYVQKFKAFSGGWNADGTHRAIRYYFTFYFVIISLGVPELSVSF